MKPDKLLFGEEVSQTYVCRSNISFARRKVCMPLHVRMPLLSFLFLIANIHLGCGRLRLPVSEYIYCLKAFNHNRLDEYHGYSAYVNFSLS